MVVERRMTSKLLRAAVVSATVLFSCAIGVGRQPAGEAQLRNPDFASERAGEEIRGWVVLPSGTPAVVTEDVTSPTGRSMKLGPATEGQPMGNLMQQFDARPLRGKRIIVRAEVRLAPHESMTQLRSARAQMWVRVDCEDARQGFFDNMQDRPIRGLRGVKYQNYAVSGIVDDDAIMVNVGLMVFGETVAHVARFSVVTAEAGEAPDAPPRELSARGLENMRALARLYGYVRYFHPSDEAAACPDWERFVAAAAERVEGAADAAELAARLGEVFGAVAPTVQVWAGAAADGPAPADRPVGAKGSTSWRHTGVGTGAANPGMQLYTSERVKSGLEKAGEGGVAPGTSVVKELGGGVWCRVPVAVWVDEESRTLPRAEGAMVSLTRPEWWSANGRDRSARLAGVIVAWNVFQHFYPYFDVCGADWAGVLSETLARAASDADEAAYGVTLQRMVAALGDGHGNVVSMNTGRPSPLNAVFAWAGASLVVARVGEGVKGVQVGDEVLSVGGLPIGAWYASSRERISAATEQWARWRACSDPSFFGSGDEPVKLRVRRGGSEHEALVPRREGDDALKEARPPDGSEPAPGVVYVNLDGAELPAWQAVLPKLEAAKGIVLDMRGYPGGAGMVMLRHLTDKMIQSAKWIVPETTMPDREGVQWLDRQRWKLQPAEPRLGANGQKVVFITDGRAISYAESCMGIVEAYKLGEIVGEATAGTNGNINPFTVCGGYYIVWTGMKVVKHDDSRHHGVGIAPTIPVERTVEGIREGRDELLEAAVRAAGGA
jgi:hypothetical protein